MVLPYYRKSFTNASYNGEICLSLLDWISAFALVLCPILQHYRGVFVEAGTEILILVFPYTLLKMLCIKKFYMKPVIPLALYGIFISIIHGFSVFTFSRELLLLFYFVAVLNKGIDIKKYYVIAKTISICAAWLIMLQYLLYYGFHFHLQLVPVGRLLDSASQWIGLATTGRISVTGTWMSIYRPSAFFLEPSHLSIFCTPVLVLNLLSGDTGRKEIRESVLVSVGMILSTSGIGIAIVAGAWILYAMFYYSTDDNTEQGVKKHTIRFNTLLFLLTFAVVFGLLYGMVGIFRSSVNRIFFSTGSGSNAIQGRTATGIRLLRLLSGSNLLFGRGNTLRISNWNVSGFFYIVFQFGWIGALLFYWFYVKSLFWLKKKYFWLTLIVVLLSFFTVHTFAAFYRMFFVCMVLRGYLTKQHDPSSL